MFFEHKVISPTVGSVGWHLVDSSGQQIFQQCLGCGIVGLQTLVHGGVYTLTVTGMNDLGTGLYTFKLWNVPPPQQFALHIGDEVSKDHPKAGAGNIETPGVTDIYTFNAMPNQQVFFQQKGVAQALALMTWRLADSSGAEIFSACLGCGIPGVQTLVRGGVYTLTVARANDVGAGTYGFKLWNVPSPQKFQVAIGDEVSKDHPKAGAGNIETPGVTDIYTFNAVPNQQVFFQQKGVAQALALMTWRLADSSGAEIFSACLGCGIPGVQTLVRGGVYTLTVARANDAGAGTYGFKLWNVPPPQHFTIAIGDTVSKDHPEAGAGTIETPGVKDIYTFNATPNQQVDFAIVSADTGLGAVGWRLVDGQGSQLFQKCLGCGKPAVQTLVQGGTYTLTVGSDASPGVGAYSFKLTGN